MRPTEADYRAALQGHASRVERYRQGKLSEDEFRPVRLGYGLYYQLDHTSHMQRIKLPGGLIKESQIEALASIADDYGRSILHVTTREDVQIHWVGMDQVIPMYERLHAVGISTRGACADSVRNITGCIHAGTLPNELFDVTPYVFALNEYFMFHPLNLTLPRKFKICFASCEQDCVQAPINDVVFFPKQRNGQLGFSVHAGGGLGSQPFLAKPVREFVPASDAILIAEAIMRLQHRYGERKNRKRARMKYVVQRMGLPKFIAEIDRIAAQLEADQGPALRQELAELVESYEVETPRHAGAALSTGSGDQEFAHWLRTNTYAQKQSGYFGCMVQIPMGDITTAQFREVGKIASDLGGGVLRATNDQNILIPWIPGNRVREVYDRLRAIELADANALHISDVSSCPGADFCSLAVSRSMGVAESIRQNLLATNGKVEELGVFRIKISGCPNSCGQHHVGDIGLTGLSIKGDDGQHHPYYSMLVGGRTGESGNVGHRVAGRFPEEEVPKAVSALADFYREQRQTGEKFPDFVDRVGVDAINQVARTAAPGVH